MVTSPTPGIEPSAARASLGDRIAGAIDVVGISNFVTFLQNTESYRRDLRRVEYGDEREPAMRAHQPSEYVRILLRPAGADRQHLDRKSTRLNSSHT